MSQSKGARAERRALLYSVWGSLLVGIAGVGFYTQTRAEAILLDGLFNLTYFFTGLLTLKVATLLKAGDSEDFPVGYAYFEPLVNGAKGVLMLLVTLLALFSSVLALFSGGREIVLGKAVIYGIVASTVCWAVVLLIRRETTRVDSPLVRADAQNWIVNAAVSSGVLGTLAVVYLIRESSLRPLVPYVDPVLVLLLCSVTIGIPMRLSWNALMELLNRSPSAVTVKRVREIVAEGVGDLPVVSLNVRVVQPGRTRIVLAHVLLPPDTPVNLPQLDGVRERIHDALVQELPTSMVDLVFTADPRWSAPLDTTDPALTEVSPGSS